MNTKELQTLAQEIKCTRLILPSTYRDFNFVREQLHNCEASLAKWCEQTWVGRRLPNIHEEGTYDGCIDMSAFFGQPNLKGHIVMWDGDSLDGMPLSRRCEWEYVIDDSLPQLLGMVERALLKAVARQALLDYENDLEQARHREIELRTQRYVNNALYGANPKLNPR